MHNSSYSLSTPHQEWIKEEEMVMAERNCDRDVDVKRKAHKVVHKRAWRYFQAAYKHFMD
jgi:hypothetical protein